MSWHVADLGLLVVFSSAQNETLGLCLHTIARAALALWEQVRTACQLERVAFWPLQPTEWRMPQFSSCFLFPFHFFHCLCRILGRFVLCCIHLFPIPTQSVVLELGDGVAVGRDAWRAPKFPKPGIADSKSKESYVFVNLQFLLLFYSSTSTSWLIAFSTLSLNNTTSTSTKGHSWTKLKKPI